MGNKKIIFLKIAIVAVLGSTANFSCKKEIGTEFKQEKSQLGIKNSVTMSSLTEVENYKIYLGKLFTLDTVKIGYDSDQQVFIMANGNISYKEIKDLYEKHPIVQYVDGKPL